MYIASQIAGFIALSGFTSNYLRVSADLPDSYKGKIYKTIYEVIE